MPSLSGFLKKLIHAYPDFQSGSRRIIAVEPAPVDGPPAYGAGSDIASEQERAGDAVRDEEDRWFFDAVANSGTALAPATTQTTVVVNNMMVTDLGTRRMVGEGRESVVREPVRSQRRGPRRQCRPEPDVVEAWTD